MNARHDQKQETRARILASAAEVLRTKGLETPSVNEVMAGAGLTVGGFYAHFDNKDELLLETLSAVIAEQMHEWLDAFPDSTADERRQLCARGYLSRKHRAGDAIRCPLPLIIGALDRVDPRYREIVAGHIDNWARSMHDVDDAEGRRRALAAIATMFGGYALARAMGATPFSDELLAAAKSAIT
jgi:TetR/AcrR family transcriptional regulator, transcriptional repressor for nem operon